MDTYLDELDCEGGLADTSGTEDDDLVLPHPGVKRPRSCWDLTLETKERKLV